MPLDGRRKLKVAAAASVAIAGCAAVVLSPIGETVASYADDTFGGGLFGADSWSVQSSSDGSDWTDHPQNAPAALNVTPSGLIKGGRAYSAFHLRVAPDSPPNAATIAMGTGSPVSPTTTTQASLVRVRAVWKDGVTCGVEAFTPSAAYLVGSPSATGTMLSAGATPVTIPNPPGTTKTVCLEFSIPNTTASDPLNGKAVTVRWDFTATSVDTP